MSDYGSVDWFDSWGRISPPPLKPKSYKVYTQHHVGGDFVVPVDVEATSPLEAAQKRFAGQVQSSQAGTQALLVVGGLRAHLFQVKTVTKRELVAA